MPFRIVWRTAAARRRVHPERSVIDQHALGVVPAVEFCGEVLEVEGDRMRRQIRRRRHDDLREFGQLGGDRQFARVVEARKSAVPSSAASPPASVQAFSTEQMRAWAYWM